MKFYTLIGCRHPAYIHKLMLVMKLTLVLLITAFLQISFAARAQKITFSEKNAPIIHAFNEIQKQTGYIFLYTDEMLNGSSPLNVDFKNSSLTDVLKVCFHNQPLTYTITNKLIIVQRKTLVQEAPPVQAIVIKGKVTDEKNVPLSGVTVTVKGKPINTSTNNLGAYTITIPAGETNAVLVYSFIGFEAKEIPVTNQTVINVKLNVADSKLDEVVVVGYGTQKKVSLTGAISSIKGSDLTVTKNESVVNMLAGKMAGVRIVQSSGEPGDYASSIQIRGFGTPLVIIDGVPRDNMAQLDPNTIESISVLKDASASIYGVRAANGVVLITTKKGAKGKAQIEYSGYYGYQTPIRTPKGLSTDQFMEIVNENNVNRGSVPPGTLIYSLAEIQDYKNGTKQGTDWSRINSNFNAPQQQHNISASGGTNDVNYFISFGDLKQDGIYSTGDLNYQRYNIRSNVSAQINKNLKVELLLNGMASTKNSPYGADNEQQYFRTVWVLPPTLPAYANYNKDYMQEVLQGYNPLATTNSDIVGYDRNSEKLFQSTANLTWDIPWVKGLKAKASYAYDYTFWEDKSLQLPYLLYQYDASNDAYVPAMHGNTVEPGTSDLTRSTRFGANSLMQGSLSYDNTFASKHHVGGLLLYEEGTTNMDNFYASRYIELTSIQELLGGVTLNQQGGQDGSGFNSALNPADQGGLWTIANKAVVGRVNYDYMSKYFADFSFRYDGSSKFAPGHQWGFFPSASAGWRISQESFIKDNSSLSFINNLKLRASFGVTGDDRTASFQFVPGYTYPVSNFSWPVRMFGDQMAAGIQLNSTPNPNLSWMTSKMYDIGLDADLWNGLFGFEFDAFRRNRDGLVGTRVGTIPDWLGESLAQENLNSDATLGLDLSLKHTNVLHTRFGDLRYGVSGNVSITRTKTVYVERLPSVDQWANWHDNPTNRYNDIWWGVNSPGQYQNYTQIFSGPIADGKGNSQLKPGDYQYTDWNGDGVIDANDQHPIATGANAQNTPMVYYGFTFDLAFKGFDMTAVFQGGALETVMYTGVLAYPFSYDGNGPAFYYDRWHMQDPLADPRDPRTVWIPGTYPTTSQSSAAMGLNYGTNSNQTIHRADYLRCKSLELGYTFPQKLVSMIGIKGLRLYGTAYNILTITGLKYLDPEHPSADNGFDYPLTRTINFGANIKF